MTVTDDFRRKLCKCDDGPIRCLKDDDFATQLSFKAGTFRRGPRASELDVSLLRGRVTVLDAVRYVTGDRNPSERKVAASQVRFTTIGALRRAGFTAVHTPGRIRNGPHISVVWSSEDPLVKPVVPWPPDLGSVFDGCFNEVEGA